MFSGKAVSTRLSVNVVQVVQNNRNKCGTEIKNEWLFIGRNCSLNQIKITFIALEGFYLQIKALKGDRTS